MALNHQQIISNFIHSVVIYERDLEILRSTLANEVTFDIYYSFQCINRSCSGVIESSDLVDLYSAHGRKVKKETLAYINRKSEDLKITYKIFMNHMLPAENVSLKEKCLKNQIYDPLVHVTGNSKTVEEQIIKIYDKMIEYAQELEKYNEYKADTRNIRFALFQYCDDGGYIDQRKVKALMNTKGILFELADFARLKRVMGSFLETRISPAHVMAFMYPKVEGPADDEDTKEEGRGEIKNGLFYIATPDVDATRSWFYIERPHLLAKLNENKPHEPEVTRSVRGSHAPQAQMARVSHTPEAELVQVQPQAEQLQAQVSRTVKFADEENLKNGINEDNYGTLTPQTRPSLGTQYQTSIISSKTQPEILIKEDPLNDIHLVKSEIRPAKEHIFETSTIVKTPAHTSELATIKVSPRNSFETLRAEKSNTLKEQVIQKEAEKFKSQFEESIASKRSLLEMAKQKRLESSGSTGSANLSPNSKRHNPLGASVVESTYLGTTRTASPPKPSNYLLSSKYTVGMLHTSSSSPVKRVQFDANPRTIPHYGSIANFNNSRPASGLYELRSEENEGPKIIDDDYLSSINRILDRKNAERDARYKEAEERPSHDDGAHGGYGRPEMEHRSQLKMNFHEPYEVIYNRVQNYGGYNDANGMNQSYLRFRPGSHKESPDRKRERGERWSPERRILMNHEIAGVSDYNNPEHMKIGTYRFGNNFYDRILP